jgi:hypothetical protein
MRMHDACWTVHAAYCVLRGGARLRSAGLCLGSARVSVPEQSVATGRARGWARTPCAHFKHQYCARLGSAFECGRFPQPLWVSLRHQRVMVSITGELTKCMYSNTMESSYLPASYTDGRALERLPFFIELQRSQQVPHPRPHCPAVCELGFCNCPPPPPGRGHAAFAKSQAEDTVGDIFVGKEAPLPGLLLTRE